MVCVVVPVLNERDNLAAVAAAVAEALDPVVPWELVFVDDDSRDGSAEVLAALTRRNPRVRSLRRVGRRGLSTAAIEGMLASSAPVLAVMDGDLQHDASLLATMYTTLTTAPLDIVIASRFAPGGSAGGLSSEGRERLSRWGNALARKVMGAPLTDPLTGFFMLRRPLLDSVVHRLSGRGFKILADIFASADRVPRWAEVPLIFRERTAGESKLDARVMVDFALLLVEKAARDRLPLGFVVQLMEWLGLAAGFALLLWLGHAGLGARFWAAAFGSGMLTVAVHHRLRLALTPRHLRPRGADGAKAFSRVLGWCMPGLAIAIALGSIAEGQGLDGVWARLITVMAAAPWVQAVGAQMLTARR